MGTTKILKIGQMTAPGTTASIGAIPYKNHIAQFTVANIDTNVVVDVQGSLNGTDFFTINPANDASPNESITDGQVTVTANGTYALRVSNTPLTDLRFRWVSESGGTAATIDPILMSSD